MGTLPKPPGKAMYVAPRTDWDWLRVEQRKLYERSEEHVDYVFCKLWGLVTAPRNLRVALARVAGNRGRRTAGVDGITAGRVTRRAEEFVAGLRSELRSGTYRPLPVRRVLIPKIGTPGKFRPLGCRQRRRRVPVPPASPGTRSPPGGAETELRAARWPEDWRRASAVEVDGRTGLMVSFPDRLGEVRDWSA